MRTSLLDVWKKRANLKYKAMSFSKENVSLDNDRGKNKKVVNVTFVVQHATSDILHKFEVMRLLVFLVNFSFEKDRENIKKNVRVVR